MTIARRMNAVLHGCDPFEGFDASAYPEDVQGWLSGEHVLDQIVDQVRPQLVIEVGTWKGLSALHMLRRALAHGDASIVCVDTWLGSPENWLVGEHKHQLMLRNGRPRIFEQFMANVIHAGLAEHVVPLPLPSRMGAEVLRRIGVTAEMIYVDAGHDEASVAEDIAAWWPLLVPGGVMAGDDYLDQWPGVKAAVHRFWETEADAIAARDGGDTKWFAQKKR